MFHELTNSTREREREGEKDGSCRQHCSSREYSRKIVDAILKEEFQAETYQCGIQTSIVSHRMCTNERTNERT